MHLYDLAVPAVAFLVTVLILSTLAAGVAGDGYRGTHRLATARPAAYRPRHAGHPGAHRAPARRWGT